MTLKIIILLLFIIILFLACNILIFIYYAFKGCSISISADNYILKGRLYGKLSDQKSQIGILFLSGWNPGNMSITTSNYYAGYYSKKYDVICLTVALRGMGSSGDINKLCRADFLSDAILAYDYLTLVDGIDKENIIVVGESFGGYLACILSTRRPLKRLSLRVPTDFANDGFEDLPQIQIAGNNSKDWKLKKHSFDESFALNAIHDFKGDILIIASGKDKIVPKQTIENYLTACSDSSSLKYVLMKHAGHGLFTPNHIWDYLRILSKWIFNKNIAQSNTDL